MALRYYNPEKLIGKELHWEVSEKGQVVDSGSLAIPDNAFDLVALGDAAITLPESADAKVYTLTLTVPGTKMKNTYELYSYPSNKSALPLSAVSNINENGTHLFLTQNFEEAKTLLNQVKRVLYLPN